MRAGRHIGWRVERCRYNFAERVFAEEWRKENRPQRGVNYGYGILQDLFGERLHSMYHRWRLMINRRDEFVVATVIQWFGTNVGWCFLERCLDRIGYKLVRKEDQSACRDYEPQYNQPQNASAWQNHAARSLFAERVKLADRPIIRVKPRKHLFRRMPGPFEYIYQHQVYCIRCHLVHFQRQSVRETTALPPCEVRHV